MIRNDRETRENKYLDVSVNVKLEGSLPKVCEDVVARFLQADSRVEFPLAVADGVVSEGDTYSFVSRLSVSFPPPKQRRKRKEKSRE